MTDRKTRNHSYESVGRALAGEKLVFILPHILADGDALGSATALCRALLSISVEARVLVEDKVADYLNFLKGNMVVSLEEAENIYSYALEKGEYSCVVVDCGSVDRFPLREKIFKGSETTYCLDHHRTSEREFDYNIIEPEAAATGEIVYDLICAMRINITSQMAEGLFTAITTDTGNFQYSNTRKKSHEIMAKLYDTNTDFNKISVELYESEPIEKIKLQGDILSGSRTVLGGKAIIGIVLQKDLHRYGAMTEHTEGLVGTLRSVSGVEIAALVKEQEDGNFKVSLRSKSVGDVAVIAENIGSTGGGHTKAAGFSFQGSKEELLRELEREMGAQLVRKNEKVK